MGFILSFIAYTLFIFLAPINFLVILIKNVKTESFLSTTNNFWKQNAIELDIFANKHYKTLWNVTLRKSQGYSFGKPNETISSSLGKLQVQNKLSWMGWIVVIILWVIDYKYWFVGGHCFNSINKHQINKL